MPQTINGIGTWYYGKKNLHQREDVCEQCGQPAVLSSYDTRTYFVIIFIPIIPLGRKHVIDECSSCSRHFAVPLKQWEGLLAESANAIDLYIQTPTDPERAQGAMQAAAQVHSANGLATLSPIIEKHLSKNVDVLIQLAVLHCLMGSIEDEERVLYAALDADDRDEIREHIANCLIRGERPEEAEPYLEHIIADQNGDKAEHLFVLAQAWQEKGEHVKALHLFDVIERLSPELAGERVFRKLRKVSEDNEATGKPVLPGKIAHRMNSRESSKKTMLVVGAIAALLAIGFVGASLWAASARTIYFVNGLHVDYTIKVNGESLRVPARPYPTKMSVGEGDVLIEGDDAPLPIPPETYSVRTPFWTRIFSAPVFVINPDQAAILTKTTIWYSSSSNPPEPRYVYLAGQPFYELDKIHYPFEEPPDSISKKSKADVAKNTLGVIGYDASISRSMLVWNLKDRIGQSVAVKICQQLLAVQPDDEEILYMLAALSDKREMIDYIKPRLADRPIRMEWHRVYQNYAEALGEQSRIQKEYEAMVAAEPEQPELYYLLARVVDRSRGEELCTSALKVDPSSPYPLYWLMGAHGSMGDFETAADYAKRLYKPDEPQLSFDYSIRQIFLSAGNFDALMECARKAQDMEYPQSFAGFEAEAYVRTVRDERAELKQMISRMVAKVNSELGKELSEYLAGRLRSSCSYVRGEKDEFIRQEKMTDDAARKFAAYVTEGKWEAALDAIRRAENSEPHMFLLLYAAAKRAGNEEIARSALDRARSKLREEASSSEDLMLIEALSDDPPALEVCRDVFIGSDDKSSVMVALGMLHPDYRESLFALAEKLNVDKRFPYLAIKEILEK